jgi:hypothetical protein
MNPNTVKFFLWGCSTTASLVAALFFIRFWRDTRDRLFALFALAFGVLAANWLGLALLDPSVETRHHLFMVRLVAFLIILVAIVDKNFRRR